MFSRKSDFFLKEALKRSGLFANLVTSAVGCAIGATTALYFYPLSNTDSNLSTLRNEFNQEKKSSASLYTNLNEAFDSLNDDFQRLDANFWTEENKQQNLWGNFDDEMEGNKSRYTDLSRRLGKLNVKLNKANASEKPGVYDSESDTPDAPFDNIVHDS